MARLKPAERRKSTRQVLQKAEAGTSRAPRAAAKAASMAITDLQTPRKRSANKAKAPSPAAAVAAGKRKVGRPRKDAQTPPMPKTRSGRPPGRPRKDTRTQKTTGATLQGHSIAARSVPKDNVQVVVKPDKAVVQAPDAPKPKRGPGRPSKTSQNSIDALAAQENAGPEPQTKQSRGRRRKANDTQIADDHDENAERPRSKRQKLKEAAERDNVMIPAEDDKVGPYNHLKDPVKIAARVAKTQATKQSKKNKGNRWTKLKEANATKQEEKSQDNNQETDASDQAAALPSPASMNDSGEEQEVSSEATDDIPIKLCLSPTEDINADSGGPVPTMSDFDAGLDDNDLQSGDSAPRFVRINKPPPVPVAQMTIAGQSDIPEASFTQLGDGILELADIVDENSEHDTRSAASKKSKIAAKSSGWDAWRDQFFASGVNVNTSDVDATAPTSTAQSGRGRSVSANPRANNSRSVSVVSTRSRQDRSVEPHTTLGVASSGSGKQLRRGRSQSKEPAADTNKNDGSGDTSTTIKTNVVSMKQTLFRSVKPKVPTIQEEESEVMDDRAASSQAFSETGEIPAGSLFVDGLDNDSGMERI